MEIVRMERMEKRFWMVSWPCFIGSFWIRDFWLALNSVVSQLVNID